MPTDPLEDYLRRSPLTPSQRADVWDAYQNAANEDDLASSLSALKVPQEVKAGLWDMKAGTASAAAPSVAPTAAPAAGKDYGLSNVVPVGMGLPGVSEEALAGTVGALKGAGHTALGAGKLVRRLVGADNAAMDVADEMIAPHGGTEKLGRFLEQGAEFVALPGPAKVKGAAKALELGKAGLGAAGLASVQGATPMEAAATGAMAGVPVAAGVEAAGKWLGEAAPKAVRAALKPTVASLKRISGAAGEGIDAKAETLMRWILDNRVLTADKARSVFQGAEHELQRVLSVKNAPTDAATRGVRYLKALESSASKQGLPGDDVALLKNATKQLLEGPMGEDVVKLVPGQGPGAIGGLVPEVSRAPRAAVPAQEALDSARASSRWTTRKAWGEQKGATTEAAKAVERAQRDAVKAAVPEAAPLLKRESMALKAAEVLDRAQQRTANRDAISLPAHVIAAGEIASGRLPVLAFAANWLRNNQLKAGVYADRLSKAIAEGNAPQTAFILQRLGVGVSPQLMTAGR